jgi:tetratricopeptide (TPR) repeat protein
LNPDTFLQRNKYKPIQKPAGKNMHTHHAQIYSFARIAIIAFLIIMQSACSDLSSDHDSNNALIAKNPDACLIAIFPHQGEALLDLEIQRYQRLLANKPNDMQQLQNLGWAFVNKAQKSFDPGFYKLAEQTALCMQLQQPQAFAALLLHGHILHNLHRFQEAENIANRLVVDRGYWYDYGLLGDVLMERGNLTAATSAYQQMMNQNPGPHAYNRAAHMRWLRGDIEGAKEMLQMSIHAHAGQNTSSLSWALTRLAEYEFQSGDINNSLNYLALLHKNSVYAPALLLQGCIKMAQGLYKQAVEVLSHAVQLNPLPEYRWALLEALSGTDATQQIRDELEHQLARNGETEDRRTYALYLASTGKDAILALALAEQELQLRQDVFTLDAVAWALRANRQLPTAQKYSNQALTEGTRSARLFYHAGVIASENGQLQDAKLLLLQAKQLEQNLWPSERRHLNQMM